MKKVEYWIDDCLSCPYHAETNDGRSYCGEHDKFFVDDGGFPDFCNLEEEKPTMRCPKWQECGVEGCPHHDEHEEQRLCDKSYCMCAGECVGCVEIDESLPVAERNDSAA